MPTITPAELKPRLAAEPAPFLVDVRTPGEFAGSFVPGSHNVPLHQLSPAALCTLPLAPEQPVYLLCRSGQRSELARQALGREWHERAVVVAGGLEAWQQAGLPVERGAGGAISLERQVRLGAGSLVLTGLLLALTVHPYFLGLAAFVGAGLVWAGLTDWCGLGLLLARAPWNSRPAR